jgi:hypothetical protein
MKHRRSQHPYGILAPAAHAGLRSAARRRTPGQRDAVRRVALFWRRRHQGRQGVRASQVASAARVVWFPQFHLHFTTCVKDRPRRVVMHRSSPVAAMYQRQVVMVYPRAIGQSSLALALLRRDHRPEHVVSIQHARGNLGVSAQLAAQHAAPTLRPFIARSTTWDIARTQRLVRVVARLNSRSASGVSVQATALRATPARLPVVPRNTTWETARTQRLAHAFSAPNARSYLDASDQAMAPHADPARQPGRPTTSWGAVRAKRIARIFLQPNAPSDSGTGVEAMLSHAGRARRPIIAPITTWAADRAAYPNLWPTHLRVRPGTGAPAQTLQTLRPSKREPLVFRPPSKAVGDPVPPSSQTSSVRQPSFPAQELAWRRAGPPAAGNAGNEWQGDSRQVAHQPHSRWLPGQGAASGPDHSFGRTPEAPALKLDSALMDRLADDVIRRVERRERIERARRGM